MSILIPNHLAVMRYKYQPYVKVHNYGYIIQFNARLWHIHVELAT